MTPEARVKREINKLLDKHGCYRFMPVPTAFGKKTLDYLVCAGGTFVAIEAKAPGKAPTCLQMACMKEIQQAGGVVFVIDGPIGLARLEGFLNGSNTHKKLSLIPETQSHSRAA